MPRENVAHTLIGDVGELHALKRAHDPALALGRRKSHQPRRVGEVLGRGQVIVEPDRVREVTDAPLDGERLAHRIVPQYAHLAARDLGQPEHHQDGGGLAGPVGAEQAEDLAFADIEINVVNDGGAPVALGQAARRDDVVGHRRPNLTTAPTMISNAAAMMPTPAMPQTVEVTTCTRTCEDAVSPREDARKVV